MGLKELRQDRGLTLVALAEKCGMQYQHLQRYEKGHRSIENMSLKNALKIADALEVDPHELLEK